MWTLAAPHLGKWQTVRWLVALQLPVMAAVIANVARGQPATFCILIALMGVVLIIAPRDDALRSA